MTPTDIRRIVAEAVKKQCPVEIHPDGRIRILPPKEKTDDIGDLSLIDFRK